MFSQIHGLARLGSAGSRTFLEFEIKFRGSGFELLNLEGLDQCSLTHSLSVLQREHSG